MLLLMTVGCGGGTSAPPGPTAPLASVSGTWTGSESFRPQQSGPAGQCVVDYFRGAAGGFQVPVTLTLSQSGTAVTGRYTGADVTAIRPFACDVTGSYVDGRLVLSLSSCPAYTFGLNPSCAGTLERRSGQLSSSATIVSTTFSADLRMTVEATDQGGSSLGSIDWQAAIALHR